MAQILSVISENNLPALRIIDKLETEAPKIDHDAIIGGLGYVFGLDNLGIYGEVIIRFYKELCKESMLTMCALMRCVELGFLTPSELRCGIYKPDQIDTQFNVNRVKILLPNFGRNNG